MIQSSGSHDKEDGSHDEENRSHDLESGATSREIHLDQVDDEFERLVKMRGRMGTAGGTELRGEIAGGVARSKSMEK